MKARFPDGMFLAPESVPPQDINNIDAKIAEQWKAALNCWSRGHVVELTLSTLPLILVMVDALLSDMLNSSEPLYIIDHSERPSKVIATSLGKKVQWVINNYNFKELWHPFLEYRPSERIRMFMELLYRLPRVNDMMAVGSANTWAVNYRKHMTSRSFASALKNRDDVSSKNADGVTQTFRNMWRRRSHVLSVRLFVGRNPQPGAVMTVSDDLRRKSQAKFIKYVLFLRRKFPQLIWDAWRLEHCNRNGYYHQMLLVFDGQDQGDDAGLGNHLADLWRRHCWGDEGIAINCNADITWHEQRGMTGLGIITKNNQKKRDGLREAALYFARFGKHAQLRMAEKGKAYSASPLKDSSDRHSKSETPTTFDVLLNQQSKNLAQMKKRKTKKRSADGNVR